MSRHWTLVLFALTACEVIPSNNPTVAQPSAAVTALGLGDRLTRAKPDLVACSRVKVRAAEVLRGLVAAEVLLPGLSANLKPVIVRWANEVRQADPVALGEMHRVYARAMEDGVISAPELLFLVETLELCAHRAGSHASSREAVTTAFSPIADGDVTTRPEVAAAVGPVLFQLADLLAAIAECAP